jgi:hypothetical protein
MAAGHDKDGLNAGKFDAEIEDLRDELDVFDMMVKPVTLPEGQMIFFWEDSMGSGSYRQTYYPSGKWETFRATLNAPPGALILFEPFQIPCQVWIRNAFWKTGDQQKKAHFQAGRNGSVSKASGPTCLTVFGPHPGLVQMPLYAGAELEFEFMVQANDAITCDVIDIVHSRLAARRQAFQQSARVR